MAMNTDKNVNIFLKNLNRAISKRFSILKLYVFFIDRTIHSRKPNYGIDPITFGDVRLERMRNFLRNLKLKQVLSNDNNLIKCLTAVDPWGIPEMVTTQYLEEGWQCFVAKHKDDIASSLWVFAGSKFVDHYLKQELHLAHNEAYLWRGFSTPGMRGKGVAVWMLNSVIDEVFRCSDKTRFFTVVRAENRAAQRTLTKSGWSMAGRIGYYEILGIRLNYLFGRGAFEKTRKRFFIQRVR